MDDSSMDFHKLKVVELKRELKRRSLGASGTKSELISRLKESLAAASEEKQIDSMTEDVDEEVEEDVINDEVEDVINDEVEEDVINEDDFLDNVDEEDKETSLSKIEDSEDLLETDASPDNIVITTEVPKMVEAPEKIQQPSKENVIYIAKSNLSNEQQLETRLKRFSSITTDSTESSDAKKQARTLRFGTVQDNSNVKKKSQPITKDTAIDIDKLKLRAQRFGTNVSTAFKKVDDDERLLKRKQRFGAVLPSTEIPKLKVGPGNDVEAKKQKRAERFK